MVSMAGWILCDQSEVAEGGQPSATHLYASALSGARAESSVKWTSVTGDKNGHSTVSSIAGTISGKQTVTLSGGLSGHLDLVLTDGVVYARGDHDGLYLSLNLTDTAATQEANQWISIPSSSPIYSAEADGLTIKSVVADLAIRGPLTETPTRRIDHQLALGVKGKKGPMSGIPALDCTLYVSHGNAPLPIRESLASYRGTSFVISFSHWNSPVTVNPPPTSVPIKASWISR